VKRALIFYEITGFGFKIYELAVTEEQLIKMQKCHGKYVNSADWPVECEWLAEFLDPYYPIYDSDDEGMAPSIRPKYIFDEVIVTGLVA